jgi:hypothetical protein
MSEKWIIFSFGFSQNEHKLTSIFWFILTLEHLVEIRFWIEQQSNMLGVLEYQQEKQLLR